VIEYLTIAMKPQPEPSTQEVLAGLIERVTYHVIRRAILALTQF
jgi:hypothetical protein